MRSEAIADWPVKVSKLYKKHFDNNSGIVSSKKIEEESNLGGITEEYNIKEELIRQNNWMTSKLKNIQEKNVKLDQEKKDLYLKI